MAATTLGRRITEAHRLAQARLGAQVAAEISAAWSLVDIADLDRTAVRWAAVSSPIVRNRRVQSANLAANYLRTFRAAELGLTAGAPVALAPSVDPAALLTSLRVTGPVKVKQALARGATAADALAAGQAASSRAAMRQVMGGARDTITNTVASDDRAQGWVRTTSANACGFCVMVSSRGPVYGSESVGFEAHDGCSCMAEPVYRDNAPWPPSAQRNHELWNAAQDAAEPGADPLYALRQHIGRT